MWWFRGRVVARVEGSKVVAAGTALAGPAGQMKSERDALEVEVGGRRLVLPLDEVHKVVEVDVDAPPPLSATWVSGLGLLGGRIVLSVSVVAQPRRKER